MKYLFYLFLLFVGLRLADIITWSWWWVTAPLWTPVIVIILAIFTFAYLYARQEGGRS